MSKHERTMRVDSVDEGGVFQMTLASEGEASDGDILSMKGGQIPERMPLLLSHWNDPTAIAGSVTNPSKELKHTPPRLRATGQIEMSGEGTLAEIRRDVAMMINKHGGAVSIRWDEVDGGDPPIRRVNLASDHPYFVDAEKEKSWRKRSGYFWPSWKGLEGSIVALGADSSATIDGRLYAQRAEETEGAVAEFWRAMADDARHAPDTETVEFSSWQFRGIDLGGTASASGDLELNDELSGFESDEVRQDAEAPVDAIEPGKIDGAEGALALISGTAKIARELCATPADIINAVVLESDGEDFTPVTIGDAEVFLPQRLADHLAAEREDRAETPAHEPEPEQEPEQDQARAVHPSPIPLDAADVKDPPQVRALTEFIEKKLDESEKRLLRNVREILNSLTGKV